MTDTPDTPTAPPGWYQDYAGSSRLRWWDGLQWTEHFHDPSLEVYGATATPIVGAGTAVYNAYIWVVIALQLVALGTLFGYDMTGTMLASANGLSVYGTPGYLLFAGLGWLSYGLAVLFSYLDRRTLLQDGFDRPFHWAWAFLGSAVYIIGRSIIVKRRAGRGLAPIWVWAVITIATIIVVIVKVSNAMSALFENLPTIPGNA
jgi:hypothetical protein